MLLICAKTLTQASAQYSKHVGSPVNQTAFRERACASERGRGGRIILSLAHERSLNTVWFHVGTHVHNCITQFFESRRNTLAPHA